MNLDITLITAIIICLLSLALIFFSPQLKIDNYLKVVFLSLAPLILIPTAFFIYEGTVSADTEYLGGYLTEAFYYEAWNERVSCRHEISCSHTCYSTSGSGKNKKTSSHRCHSNDGYYHSYDVDYHEASWEVHDSNDNTWNISQHEFDKLANQWNSKLFQDMHRDYHTIDGDLWKAIYDGKPEHIHATTLKHSYKNKIPYSYSILKGRNISDAEKKSFGLFDYPPVERYSQHNILSYESVDYNSELRFEHLNAVLGRKYQIRVYILLFKNQPLDAALAQEALWQKGNKNELDIAIGLGDNNSVMWAYVISWTDQQAFKDSITEHLVDKSLNLNNLADFLWQEIPKQWVRREFTPLNKQIKVVFPAYLAYSMLFITLSANITLIFCIHKGTLNV